MDQSAFTRSAGDSLSTFSNISWPMYMALCHEMKRGLRSVASPDMVMARSNRGSVEVARWVEIDTVVVSLSYTEILSTIE